MKAEEILTKYGITDRSIKTKGGGEITLSSLVKSVIAESQPTQSPATSETNSLITLMKEPTGLSQEDIEEVERCILKLHPPEKDGESQDVECIWEFVQKVKTQPTQLSEEESLVKFSEEFWESEGKPSMTHAYTAKLLKAYRDRTGGGVDLYSEIRKYEKAKRIALKNDETFTLTDYLAKRNQQNEKP